MSNLHFKKSLGQHFLKDESVLRKIVSAIGNINRFKTVVEIGPGSGALTRYLLEAKHQNFFAVELDDRWSQHLGRTFPALRGKVIHEDFLQTDLSFMQHPALITGNFPYNISSQIIFRIIDYKEVVTEMVGMFQKEVAIRITAIHGSKDYGIISVLTQAYYDCTYLFDIAPDSFDPAPKVMSGVIRLNRNEKKTLGCDEALFKRVVKTAFNQRRKTMRNSLKETVNEKAILANEIFDLRPEQISVGEFIRITNMISPGI